MQTLTDIKVPHIWKRINFWVSHHQLISRLICLTVGLIVFPMFLPVYMRIYLWDSLLSHKILASMLLIFSLLAISLVWSTGQQLDDWAFLFFNMRGSRPIWLDRMMLGFTQIGNGFTALGIAVVLFFTNDHLLSYQLILGSLALWLMVVSMKFLIHRSRPFIRVTQARIVGRRANGQSFPSGHTSQAFFTAMLMAQYFHASIWVIILLYAAAILVGITRMYVGAHYPRDVLAGAILGSAWGLLGVIINSSVLKGIG
jgi:membrane-associated phospholipid phosphatase